MKKVIKLFLVLLFIGGFDFLNAKCIDLETKYNSPDPSIKTMRQLNRWAKRKMRGKADKEALLECLVAKAADNPNKSTVAGQ